MENLKEILDSAEENVVDELSNYIKNSVEEGFDFQEIIEERLGDFMYERVYEIADSAMPVYDSDIVRIVSNDIGKVSEAFDRAKNEMGAESLGLESRNFVGIMSIGLYHLIEQHLLDNGSDLEKKASERAILLLKANCDELRLGEPEYILELITDSGQPWPFIVANDNVKDNPVVLLEAANISDWVCKYASPRLSLVCENNNPIIALESIILKNKLEDTLKTESNKKNKSKI